MPLRCHYPSFFESIYTVLHTIHGVHNLVNTCCFFCVCVFFSLNRVHHLRLWWLHRYNPGWTACHVVSYSETSETSSHIRIQNISHTRDLFTTITNWHKQPTKLRAFYSTPPEIYLSKWYSYKIKTIIAACFVHHLPPCIVVLIQFHANSIWNCDKMQINRSISWEITFSQVFSRFPGFKLVWMWLNWTKLDQLSYHIFSKATDFWLLWASFHLFTKSKDGFRNLQTKCRWLLLELSIFHCDWLKHFIPWESEQWIKRRNVVENDSMCSVNCSKCLYWITHIRRWHNINTTNKHCMQCCLCSSSLYKVSS